jgi:hypothetical protein
LSATQLFFGYFRDDDPAASHPMANVIDRSDGGRLAEFAGGDVIEFG